MQPPTRWRTIVAMGSDGEAGAVRESHDAVVVPVDGCAVAQVRRDRLGVHPA
ncbi:hypothetical protein GCM10009772_50040 [Pseudonocardia alni subsp. carboxydivorans]